MHVTGTDTGIKTNRFRSNNNNNNNNTRTTAAGLENPYATHVSVPKALKNGTNSFGDLIWV